MKDWNPFHLLSHTEYYAVQGRELWIPSVKQNHAISAPGSPIEEPEIGHSAHPSPCKDDIQFRSRYLCSLPKLAYSFRLYLRQFHLTSTLQLPRSFPPGTIL
jgi:hypothetical protein